MRFRNSTILVLALAAAPCFATADTFIEIKSDGTLVGLPKSFQPSSIRILFDGSGSQEHPVESLSVTLGKNTLQIPKGLLGLLRSKNIEALSAYASWYHEPTVLPHYLVITFLDPGFDKSRSDNSGYLMRFNLHTGKLISMAIIIVTKPRVSWEHRSINISQYCTPSELAQCFEPQVIK